MLGFKPIYAKEMSMQKEAVLGMLPSNEAVNLRELLQSFRWLYENTLAPDNCDNNPLLSVYDECRGKPVYQSIEKRMAAGDPVTQPEYLFYALVTDDVSGLDPKQLDYDVTEQLAISAPDSLAMTAMIQLFMPNLNILSSALRHQNRPTAETFASLFELLSLRAKACAGVEHFTVLWLNLSGIRVHAVKQPMGSLDFRYCHFVKARLNPKLSFSALHAIFIDLNLGNSDFARRSYTHCELRGVKAKMSHCQFERSNIVDSKLSITMWRGLHFAGCDIKHSEVYICGTRDDKIARIDSCKVTGSKVMLGNGCLRWRNNVLSEVVISSDSTRFAQHDFEQDNQIKSTDLRNAQLTDAGALLSSEQLSMEEPSLLCRERLFADLEVFHAWLSDVVQGMHKDMAYSYKDSRWIHKSLGKKQEAFARVLVAHIRAYFPVESHSFEAVGFLSEALKHEVFKHQNENGLNLVFASLFPAYSTATKAREILNEALNETRMDCSLHTALSRLASF